MKRRKIIKLGMAATVSGLLASSREYSGNGRLDSEAILQFGVVADPQYANVDSVGTRYYRNSIAKLASAIETFNKLQLDFVVTLGDVIDRDFQSFDAVMPLYEKCKHETRFVLGNHDFSVDDSMKAAVGEKLGLNKNWFAETKCGVKLIYLDGTDVSLYRDSRKSDVFRKATQLSEKLKKQGRKHIHGYNSAVGDRQLQFLKDELAASEKLNEPVIIFCHFPVMPLGAGHNLWNDAELVEIIKTCPNVVAYMNGHKHRGGYVESNDTHFLNFKGMVETEKDNAYAVVSVFADRIEVVGEGLEPKRKLVVKQRD